jgi:poly(ADP-ribose) glycohydrolase ARH3
MPATKDQFVGCLIGQAVGDALGAPCEGLSAQFVYELGPASVLVENPKGKTLYYTDDTQMAIGVAETLTAYGEIREEALCEAFGENYQPERGYGQGARRILEAMILGADWRELTRTIFPGGSLGNGAAMRVAPVGMMFCDDLDRVAFEAQRSAVPTHVHPLGIDGARLLALAVALAAGRPNFVREDFFGELMRRAQTEEFQWQLSVAKELGPDDTLIGFGNSLEAHRSVVTAIACFAASPDFYPEVISRAIGQGNDTDTLAAMAGAISGARLGILGVPRHLVESLEDGPKGSRYLHALAERLYEAHAARRPPG